MDATMAGLGTGRSKTVPQNYEGAVNLIAGAYPGLSTGYQQIARFFTQNPNVVALASISTIAANCGAHPSSLVRFAQNLGYTGFKQLQAVFQTRLATAAPGFRERIGALDDELSRKASRGNRALLKDLVVRDMAALQGLLDSVSEDALTGAARLFANARTIYVAGQLRSEPIALLLRYLLTMLRRRAVLLDPAGGLAQEMAATMGQGDVLVAIAFRHYAKEVIAIAEAAVAAAVPVVAVTDSQLSPLARDARILFTLPEDEYGFSRSLAAPMCLVQTLATVTAAVLKPSRGAAPRIPGVTEIARERRAPPAPRRRTRKRG
jgi:DNA-binding MurR/RpiR family transcriptional regulator